MAKRRNNGPNHGFLEKRSARYRSSVWFKETGVRSCFGRILADLGIQALPVKSVVGFSAKTSFCAIFLTRECVKSAVILGLGKKSTVPAAGDALPDRADVMPTAERHTVLGNPMRGPWPDGFETVLFGMGCFWGVERLFWKQAGVYTTAVGYAGGHTANATYRDVCTGKTGHNEVCLVVFDPSVVSFDSLLKLFWESHDPTQGMQQGPDRGTQYRSGVYTTNDKQHALALASKDSFQSALRDAGYGDITTEILPAPEFYYAEDEHQQYLQKNPNGYCSMRGTGTVCVAPGADTTLSVAST